MTPDAFHAAMGTIARNGTGASDAITAIESFVDRLQARIRKQDANHKDLMLELSAWQEVFLEGMPSPEEDLTRTQVAAALERKRAVS